MLLTAIFTCVVGNPGVAYSEGQVFEVDEANGEFLLSQKAARTPTEDELVLHDRLTPKPKKQSKAAKPAAPADEPPLADDADDGV